MRNIPFHKVQGAGNDFVLFDPEFQPDAFSTEDLRLLCDRHFGVGSDGVLFVCPSERAHVMMRMFNPDGSEAEMCGNGIRCFAKHVFDAGVIKERELKVESRVGVHLCKLFLGEDGKVDEVEVGMGQPQYERGALGMEGQGEFVDQAVQAENYTFKGTGVSMGNPHLVIFHSLQIPEAEKIGPLFESHPDFKHRTNVEFVEQLGEQHLRVVVYERGAGITLACGTGACATVAAAAKEGRVSREQPTVVDLPGGRLTIRFDEQSGEIWMRGPARYVFSGSIELPER